MSSPVKILIVDDEPDTVGLIELTLTPAGFHVEQAYSGTEALARIRADKFNLILLDVMMPEVSGFDVARELKEDPNPPPPIIFLTARGRQQDIRTGDDLGAAGYLVKPATRGQLLDAIQSALYEGSEADASG